MKGLLTAALLASSAYAASADDTTVLFSRGFWTVTFETWDDGTTACAMSSDDKTGRSITIWLDEDGATFHMFNPSWNMEPRDVPVHVDVDYTRFNAIGTVKGNSLFVPDLTVDFIAALADGNAMAVFNGGGDRLLTYSLRGSYAATVALIECGNKTQTHKTAPVMYSSDPWA